MHSKTHIQHADLHTNNVALKRVFYEKPSDNEYMYSIFITDKIFKVRDYAIRPGIIDFSRSFIFNTDQIAKDFDTNTMEVFMDEQWFNIFDYLTVRKYTSENIAQLKLLYKSNPIEFGKLISVIDIYDFVNILKDVISDSIKNTNIEDLVNAAKVAKDLDDEEATELRLVLEKTHSCKKQTCELLVEILKTTEVYIENVKSYKFEVVKDIKDENFSILEPFDYCAADVLNTNFKEFIKDDNDRDFGVCEISNFNNDLIYYDKCKISDVFAKDITHIREYLKNNEKADYLKKLFDDEELSK
jgi:hypothetical protein